MKFSSEKTREKKKTSRSSRLPRAPENICPRRPLPPPSSSSSGGKILKKIQNGGNNNLCWLRVINPNVDSVFVEQWSLQDKWTALIALLLVAAVMRSVIGWMQLLIWLLASKNRPTCHESRHLVSFLPCRLSTSLYSPAFLCRENEGVQHMATNDALCTVTSRTTPKVQKWPKMIQKKMTSNLKILSKYKGRFSIKTLSTQENTDTDKTTSLYECTTL